MLEDNEQGHTASFTHWKNQANWYLCVFPPIIKSRHRSVQNVCHTCVLVFSDPRPMTTRYFYEQTAYSNRGFQTKTLHFLHSFQSV